MTREELRCRGAEIRETLGLPAPPVQAATGFDAFMTESSFGAIWARDGLSLGDRCVCTLATLTALGRKDELGPMIGASLRAGLSPHAILEVFAHTGLYSGFGSSEVAMNLAAEIFEARGIDLDTAAPRDDSLETLTRRGQDFIASLHGERSTKGYADPENPFTGELYGFGIQYFYGELWQRPALGLRERLLCAVVAFTVGSFETQLRKFVHSARSAGISQTEILEAIIQTSPYGGVVRSLNALAIVGDELGDTA